MGQEYIKNVVVSSTIPTFSEPVFFDDFEGVFNWVENLSDNATASSGKNGTDVYAGSNALRLIGSTLTPAANERIGVQRYLGGTDKRYVEFASFFRPDDGNDTQRIAMTIDVSREGVTYGYRMVIDMSILRVQYENSAGSLVSAHSDDFTPQMDGWNFAKMIVDTIQNKYVRLQVNSRIFDLRNIDANQGATTGIGYLAVSIYGQTTNADSKTYYFDNVSVKGADNV